MPSLEGLDQGMVPWFEAHRQDWLTQAMLGITHTGDDLVVHCVAGLAAALLLGLWFYRGGWKAAIILVLVTGAAFLLETGTKQLVKRERPIVANPPLPIKATYGFPSGHATNTAAVYLGAALLFARRLRARWLRAVVVVVPAVLVFLVGVSRLYLCQHYLTDVLGGWMAGLALALLGLWLNDRAGLCS